MNDASMYQGSTNAQTVEKTATVQMTAQTGEDSAAEKKSSIKTGDTNNSGTQNNNNFGNSEQLKNAVNDLNKKMNNSEAVFGIHEKTNRVMIKIVDKDSKKVIKEYPAEETLDMIAKVWEVAGLMVDEKR
jgi:flagellar protein FlaG